MGILNLIRGKSFEDYERSGDNSFRAGFWGQAKIEYETALDKLEKKAPDRNDDIQRIREKITRAKEALSLKHKQDGGEMMESGCFEDARDRFALGLELTGDPDLRNALEALIKKADDGIRQGKPQDVDAVAGYIDPTETPSGSRGEGDDYFLALCSALPPDVRKAYMGYGNAFREGYLALNNGEFERASELLSKAMEENPSHDSYIPFELATAYLNLGKMDEAEELLMGFLQHHPDSLPACQALCEIYWERGEYDRAEALIESCPEDMGDSPGALLLRGETMVRAGKYSEARAFLSHALERFGWHEAIAGALANVHALLGEKAPAIQMYGRILKECTTCGSRPDPVVKRMYADLLFESGKYTSQVLELYLSLAREDPENMTEYYIKASRIFEEQGHPEEAQRFKQLAEMES